MNNFMYEDYMTENTKLIQISQKNILNTFTPIIDNLCYSSDKIPVVYLRFLKLE